MPVEVQKNELGRLKRRTRRNTRDALEDAKEATAEAMRANIPVSGLTKDHAVDTIEGDLTEGRNGVSVVVKAGGPDAPYVWFIEAGTGRHFDPPDADDPAPPSSAPDEWVYFNPYLGSFFTTSGNEAQPFAGPAYEVGRALALERLERVVR